jgi:RNA polymerase sporulation-specific sigma factor
MQADQNARLVLHADQELAALVQKGDKDAFSVLCGRYSELITGRAARYSGTIGAEVEDFAQEGLLALYRAACGYSACGQAAFRTYATTCINNAMSTALKKHLKHFSKRSSLPLERLDDIARDTDFALPELTPDQVFIDREDARDYARLIKANLSRFEQQVLRMYFRGCSYRQISDDLSTSTKAVDNALQRVRRKLRLHL